jgi:hypothetical protein
MSMASLTTGMLKDLKASQFIDFISTVMCSLQIISVELEPKTNIRIKLLLPLSGIGVPFLLHIVCPTLVINHLHDAHCSCRMRRHGWPKHKVRNRILRDVFIVIIVVIWFMGLLGASTVTMTSRATRSSWRICAATTTWVLSTRAHLLVPLSERNIILIGALLDHLLAGPTHLRGCANIIRDGHKELN